MSANQRHAVLASLLIVAVFRSSSASELHDHHIPVDTGESVLHDDDFIEDSESIPKAGGRKCHPLHEVKTHFPFVVTSSVPLSSLKLRTDDVMTKRKYIHMEEDFMNAFGFFFGFSKENLEFSFFALHDYDNNTRLDGLELLKALSHVHHHHHSTGSDPKNSNATPPPLTPEDIKAIIEKNQVIVDRILNEDDVNNDGFISYPEYKISRQAKKALKVK